MSGETSQRRSRFDRVIQHDAPLRPNAMGGPVLDLDGNVIGINIARGGRVKSYAVPVDKLRPLLGDVSAGHFTVSDLAELRSAAEEAMMAGDYATGRRPASVGLFGSLTRQEVVLGDQRRHLGRRLSGCRDEFGSEFSDRRIVRK